MAKKKKEYGHEKVPFSRSDTFKLYKILNLRINNEQYIELKAKLFLLELTLQDIIHEFITLLSNEDKRATSILNGVLTRKNTCKLKQIKYTRAEAEKSCGLTKKDKNTIYDFFEKEEND